MYKLYLYIFLFVVLFFAYVIGVRQGKTQCRGDIAVSANQNVLQKYADELEKKEKINEKVINTTTDDIRSILRKQYTIAE